MNTNPLEKVDYLHDADVYEIRLIIDESGERELHLRLRGHPECGYEEWNGKEIRVTFYDPRIVLGELFGHVANGETLNAWRHSPSASMQSHVRRHVGMGLPTPNHFVEIVLHSGSLIEVACNEIRFVVGDLGEAEDH